MISLTHAAKRLHFGIAAVAIYLMMAGAAQAQWVHVTLPHTPRTPDGKTDLTAPTPKTADGKPNLSGVWRADAAGGYADNLPGTDVPMLPWAEALYKQRKANFGIDKPQVHCMPHGVPDAMALSVYPFKMVQTPDEVVVLYEEMNTYRQIFTDGRTAPVNPDPAWYGFSVGKWDGDTFVVETSGFKEGTWLDNGGHPHTEALHTTERFRRTNYGNMEMVITIDDPKAYPKTWNSATMHFKLQPDTELIEDFCNENNRDEEQLAHGK